MLDLIAPIEAALAAGQVPALATVIQTWGSAPRGPGAKMSVGPDLQMAGSVSGGCVEGAVAEEAQQVLAAGGARRLHYGVSDDTAWGLGLACGGEMDIWLEVLDPAWWAHIRAALAENRPLFSSTLLNTPLAGQKALFGPDGALVYQTPAFPAALFAPLQILSPQKTAMHTWGEYEVLVDPLLPRPRLIIIGGVHIAMPLCQMAALLGFEVHIIDPRRAFASPERFPQAAAIHQAYPDKALADLGLGDQTYLAILSHDPKIDDRALLAALPHQPAYIGVLSSRRSHQLRLDRLRAAGIRDEGLLAQIKTPIGLDIRAQSPAEIALAILAEVVALKNKI